MTTWQPIETAPKDGTRFIAYKPKYTRADRRDGYAYTAVVFYRREDDVHPDYIGNPKDVTESDLITVYRLLTAWSHHYLTESFTHWMSLPEPPEDTHE